MTETTSVTVQALLRFALPLGTTQAAGTTEQSVTYAVTVRAQPPAFPELYGGELALVSMGVLRSYDSRITLSEVMRSLAQAGVNAVAVHEEVTPAAVDTAVECGLALLVLPTDSSLPRVERAVNTLIINHKAQMQQRAIEVQRQLTRQVAENRDINSLLQIVSRATGRPVVVHDDAGVLLAQIYPAVTRRPSAGARPVVQGTPFGAFQTWLQREAPAVEGAITASPIGFTIALKVEKRTAGFLSLIEQHGEIEEFDRLVMMHGADVCAIELAKSRAIASAVEQARGDWVQMWLSGTPADDDMLSARALQSGFDPATLYAVAVFRAVTAQGVSIPLDGLLPLVRDDLSRRQSTSAAGQYVDALVALYPLENAAQVARARRSVDELRQQLAQRTPNGMVAAGLSRPVTGLSMLREAYREAKDAVSIAYQLDDREQTTFYGDLKLFQLLLAMKERNLEQMRRFHRETLGALVEHDERRQGELIRTLDGFFAANGNLARAATDLDVHRNTLVYRLDRIAELTGLDLDDADNRLVLQLALKIQRVLATLPSN